jgi:hypothetical protein
VSPLEFLVQTLGAANENSKYVAQVTQGLHFQRHFSLFHIFIAAEKW